MWRIRWWGSARADKRKVRSEFAILYCSQWDLDELLANRSSSGRTIVTMNLTGPLKANCKFGTAGETGVYL